MRGEQKSMLEKLFKTNNIKYVVSVDDCYFTPKQEEVKAKIFSEMCSSIEPFRECLKELGKEAQVKELDELIGIGQDVDSVLVDLIEQFTESEILKIYELTDQNNSIYDAEKRGITDFLLNMQEKGYIEKYWTFHSTMLAANFDIEAENLNTGSILWLLDRNFERVGESSDAGINLAKTIVQRDGGRDNFVYVLSAVGQDRDKSEDEIEAEFDDVLLHECDLTIASFVYYISKERVLSKNTKKIAKSLAQGFKRKVCYELFDIYKDCLVDSVNSSKEKILHINQKTLNYLFDKIVTKTSHT